MDKVFVGIEASNHSDDVKRRLLQQVVGVNARRTDVADADLSAVFCLALSWSLSEDASQSRRDMGVIILKEFAEGQREYLNEFFGHETIIDFFDRANASPSTPIPAAPSASAPSTSASAIPSPPSSGPPTPSSSPPSPSDSVSSTASFPPTIQSGDEDAGSATGACTGTVAAIVAAPTSRSFRFGFPRSLGSEVVSDSASRLKGICPSSNIDPAALLDALTICLDALSPSRYDLNRRHKVIAANAAKFAESHSSLHVASALVTFLHSQPCCVPVGDGAAALGEALVDVLAFAKPAIEKFCDAVGRPLHQSPGGAGLVEFRKGVNAVASFLPRLWGGGCGGYGVGDNEGDAAASISGESSATPTPMPLSNPILLRVIQRMFEFLLAPRNTTQEASRNPGGPTRCEPLVALLPVLAAVPPAARDTVAGELARHRDQATDDAICALLERMLSWVNLFWNVSLVPAVVEWVEAVVGNFTAEWRFSPLINVYESQAPSLWAVVSIVQKKMVVRQSALKLLTYLSLGYQHSSSVFFGKLCAAMWVSVPQLVIDESSRPLLPHLSVLIRGLLRLHGLPKVFLQNPLPLFPALRLLPDVDVWKLEELFLQYQWNSKQLPRGWVGLRNLGNTCYANSVIQSLRACAEFSRDVLEIAPPPSTGAPSSSDFALKQAMHDHALVVKFQTMLTNLVFSQQPIYDPTRFLFESRPPWFGQGSQQDCSEFLKYFLDQLHEVERRTLSESNKDSASTIKPDADAGCAINNEATEVVGSKRTTVSRRFGGKLLHSFSCHECGNVSRRDEVFTDLPLAFVDAAEQEPESQGVDGCVMSGDGGGGDESQEEGRPSKVLRKEMAKVEKEEIGENVINSEIFYDAVTHSSSEIDVVGVDQELASFAPPKLDAASFDPFAVSKKLEAIRATGDADDTGFRRCWDRAEEEEPMEVGRPEAALGDDNLIPSSTPSPTLGNAGVFRPSFSAPLKAAGPAVALAAPAAPSVPTLPHSYSLQKLLSSFLRPETLQGDNAYQCERCDGLRSATHRVGVAVAPQYLILTLLRFKFDAKTQTKWKISAAVEIPEELELPLENEEATRKEDGEGDTSKIFTSSSVSYQILSVIVHVGGSTDSGHYYTYVRTRPEADVVMVPAKEGWVMYNDCYVRGVNPIDIDAVLKRGSGAPGPSAASRDTPYVLIYVRNSLEASTRVDLPGFSMAPTPRDSTRELVAFENLQWLKARERSKSGVGISHFAQRPRAVAFADACRNLPPGGPRWPKDDDEDKGGGGGGRTGRGGGPCGGPTFGGLGNGPRFVF